MPTKEKQLFTDEALILPLLNLLTIKESKGAAKKSLTLFEEPALEYLEDRPITPSISEMIVAKRKAMTKRLKKYPNRVRISAAGL